jgi:hypothetical protein
VCRDHTPVVRPCRARESVVSSRLEWRKESDGTETVTVEFEDLVPGSEVLPWLEIWKAVVANLRHRC